MSRSSRRAFLGTLGAARLPFRSSALTRFVRRRPGCGGAGSRPGGGFLRSADRGGRVIDASQNLTASDVAIANGKIAAVAANIPADRAREVFDARGKLVTPG